MVVGVHSPRQVGSAGRPVGAQQPGRRKDGVRGVVGARRIRPAGRHRLVVGGEGSRLELHRSLGPRGIGAAVDPGQGRLAVVRLDGADGRQDRPRQPGTRTCGLLVQRQHGRGDLRRGGRGRSGSTAADTEERGGRRQDRRSHNGRNQPDRQPGGDETLHWMVSRRTTRVDATPGNGRPVVATDTSKAPWPDTTDRVLSALQPLRSGALEEVDRQVTHGASWMGRRPSGYRP